MKMTVHPEIITIHKNGDDDRTCPTCGEAFVANDASPQDYPPTVYRFISKCAKGHEWSGEYKRRESSR